MVDRDILAKLKSLHFEPTASGDYLDQLASIAEYEEFPANAFIFREGDTPSHLYLVIDGQVSLEFRIPGHTPKRIHTVGSAELLGWSPALGKERMTATARTITPTKTIKIGGSQLLALCEHNTRFGYEFMRRTSLALARRLDATRLQMLDVYRDEIPDAPIQDTAS
mgnify:CR=1 FL=1